MVKDNICSSKEIIVDDASKMPHEIPTKASSEEKAVYLLKEDGKTTNIRASSYVLNQIMDKIAIYRLYVPYEKKDRAKEYISTFL